MASGRMLQRRISKNEAIALVAQGLDESMGFGHGGYAALLFTWAIAHQDVEGRIEGDARLVRGNVFPMLEWVTSAHVARYLQALGDAGLLVWYEVQGKRYLCFPGFDGAQPYLRKDRESPSVLPPPEGARLIAGSFSVGAGETPAEVPADSGKTPGLKSEVRSLKFESVHESTRARVKSGYEVAGVLTPDAGMTSETIRLIEAYAQASGEEPSAVADRAFDAARKLTATWSVKRLTPVLFVKHWDAIQGVMSGADPAPVARGKRDAPGASLKPLPPMDAVSEDSTGTL